MSEPNIVILDGQVANPGDLSWQPIERFGSLEIHARTPDHLVVERAKNAEIIIVNKTVLRENHFHHLPKLKLICTLATGYNNIDIEAARHFGIRVCNAVGYSSPSVAQHVFAMILELANQIALHNESVQNGDWANSQDWCYWKKPLTELAGQTLGIFGFGKIGEAVAKIGLAFDMKIIATRRNPKKGAMKGVDIVSEEQLFIESDFLTLHAPLTEETNEIINTKNLSKMKASAILINTGRGGLIREIDLKNALQNNKIAGAGLDVLSEEPPPAEHPLVGIPNCLITPHIAWATKASRERLIKIVGKNVEFFLAGKLQNLVV